jgi:hypothetical protein
MSDTLPAIYKPNRSDGYELCQPINSEDFERIIVQVNGIPRQSAWKPIAMQIHREDEGRKLLESDSPWLGAHALLFKPRAIDAIGLLLRANGELLPVLCGGTEVLIYNPTRVLDALDEGASSVLRFGNGQLMMIKRHAFHPEIVKAVDIFKIPNLRNSPTFVGQRFVDLWNSAGLKGLDFERVWPTQ